MSVTIARARADEFGRVEDFYREQLGRDVPLAEDCELYVVRDGQAIVAAVRLCREGGTLLLRTMIVAAPRRGQGIGRQLLRAVSSAIGERECWCFPWAHLERFYAAIGFVPVPETSVPRSVRHRLGPECIPTRRGPAT